MSNSDSGDERWFDAGDGPRSDHIVSSAAIVTMGGHERVRIWSRGGLAGELIVNAGDGQKIAEFLGLTEKDAISVPEGL